MKIGPISEALGCLVFQDSPSYKLLDVAKDHGQTILMVSQSIMIPVDIRWHVDLPTSFTVSPKRARKRFGRYGQMLTVMSSKKQVLPQHSAALRCSLGALLNGQVMFFVMACTWRLASYTWKWPPSLGTTQRSTFQATGQLSSFGCLLIRVWFPRPSGHGNWNWLFSDYIETRLPHTVPWLFVWYFLLPWPRACFFSLIYVVHPTRVSNKTFVSSLLGRKHRFGLLCLKWFEDVLN